MIISDVEKELKKVAEKNKSIAIKPITRQDLEKEIQALRERNMKLTNAFSTARLQIVRKNKKIEILRDKIQSLKYSVRTLQNFFVFFINEKHKDKKSKPKVLKHDKG